VLTRNFDGVDFAYNVDFLGEVTIFNGEEKIDLPISALEKFILEKLRNDKIQKLENVSHAELKKLLLS
jgi:hypothetical protein